MKKLFLLFIAIAFIFMGCVTTTDNQVSENETSAYRPQYNMFEENDWISISDVQFYQDEASLYLFISYDSENAGKYSIFNPPSGDAFKLMGDLAQGTGTILQSIAKDSLNGIEGMTALLYSGDFSNESNRVGLFINSEEIRINQIPQRPGNLTIEPSESTDDSSSPQIVNNQEVMNDGSTPETAVSYAEFIFPEDFLSNMADYFLDEKTYKWMGRYVKVQFLISEKIESFQEFVDSGDLRKEYSIDDLIELFGEPLFYMAGMDYYLTDENLPDIYTMVYTASWSDGPTASLGIDIENGKPVLIETKYYGWFDINGISIGQQFSEFEDMVDVVGTLSREDAYARTQAEGELSIDKHIVDSGKYVSYSDLTKPYKITWEKDSETGIFIMHIYLNQVHTY